MRIPRTWVPIIARRVIESLVERNLVETKVDTAQLIATSEEIIMNEMMVEDRLNDEVREMLKQYEKEIDSKRLDYRRLFDMTKQKLVKDRNIIL